jgi:ABC-type multidrug transport system fused ATPase/permease subunit
MIPQEPILFKGTIRSNLDLQGKFNDSQIWEALEKVGLKSNIDSQSDKLEGNVEEKGSNYSIGQRQLLCLARAILEKPKVLLLDEATSSVDVLSDQLIQKVLLEDFKETTLISIAHRLETIVGFDKILVMDQGRAAEFDTPQKLLNDPFSLFTDLCSTQGSLKNIQELLKK